jgi:ubiquinone/menaquinone biosynthesis C-methylase UbiE
MAPSSEKRDYYRTEYSTTWSRRIQAYLQADERVRYYNHFLEAVNARAGERILDCGIGIGRPLALQLAQRGCQMYGIDISETLLAECVRSFGQASESIEVVQGGLEDLPFQPGFFDRVYASSVIWRVDNVAKAVKEMHRVTRRGGMVVFDTLNPLHITPAASHLYHWALVTFLRKPKALANVLLPPWKWQRLLRQLGFEVKSQGFFILLPTSFPLLDGRLNLCRRSQKLSFGLADSCLRHLGEKLLYVCRKR